MKLVKLFAESVQEFLFFGIYSLLRMSFHFQGAAAIHMEDQLHGGKKVCTYAPWSFLF